MIQKRGRLREAHDFVVFGCILIALVCVPIPLGSNRPVAWFAWETGVYGLLAFWALGLLLGCDRPRFSVSSTRILTLLAVWLGLVLLQSLSIPGGVVAVLNPIVHALQLNLGLISVAASSTLSVDPGTSYNEVLKYGSYVAMLALTVAAITTKQRMLIVVGVVIAAGALESLFGIYTYASGYVIFPESGAATEVRAGTFVNSNHFANMLAMSLGLTFGMLTSMVNSQEEGSRLNFAKYGYAEKAAALLLGGAAVVLAAGLLISGARPPFVFLAVSFAIVLGASTRSGNREMTGEIALTPLMLMGVVVVVASMVLDGSLSRLFEGDFAGGERMLQNSWGLKLLSVAWIAGIGAGNYQWIFPMFRGDDLRFVTYDYAHNDYLQTAIEQGIFVSAILGLATLLIVRELYRGYRHRRNPLIRGVILGCLMSTVFMLLHATIEFNFRIPANAAYFYVIAGIGIAACRIERGTRRSSRSAENSGADE